MQKISHQLNRRNLVSSVVSLAMTLSLFAIAGCGGSDSGDSGSTVSGTSYGSTRKLGNGTVRSFITRSAGVPQSYGIEFTETARENLPANKPGINTTNAIPIEILTTLPENTTKDTGIEGLSLFMSIGHAPAGSQDVPHWHMEAFVINDQDRHELNSTLDSDPSVNADYLPKDYISGYVFISEQGWIYINPSEPMWTERPFSTTGDAFYYANGYLTTMELSAADSFLAKKTRSEFDIPQPKKFQKPGYYPTHGIIDYDASRKVYIFTMDKLVKHE